MWMTLASWANSVDHVAGCNPNPSWMQYLGIISQMKISIVHTYPPTYTHTPPFPNHLLWLSILEWSICVLAYKNQYKSDLHGTTEAGKEKAVRLDVAISQASVNPEQLP